MIPVDQQQLSSLDDPYAGDCFRACVRAWLRARDLDAVYYVPADFPDTGCPPGWAIAGGTSPRFPDILHAVVARDGAVVHDPHPARAGLPDGIQDYIVIHGPDGAWTRYNGEQEPE